MKISLSIPVILIMIFCLAACTGQPVYKPVTVDVPVSVPCASTAPVAPAWPTLALKRDAGMVDRLRALAAENELRKGYEKELQAAISGCN